MRELKAWLRQQRFDIAIIVLGDQFAEVLAEVGIPVRVGVRGHLLEPCLTHTYDIGSPRTWGPSQRLGALRALGCDARDVPPRLWVSDAARDQAQRRLGALGLPDKAPYAVVHPFGRTPRQRWPLERVAELAEGLWSRHALRTVVIGGPATRGQVPTAGGDTLVDATGVLGIQDLLGAVQDAQLAVSTDSGPFHIAGALGRPLVGLFRARRPEHANRYPQAQVVFGRDAICEEHCRWDHCRTLPCRQLDALPVAKVLEAVRLAQRDGPLEKACKMAGRPTADTCEPCN
jgi:ADP-heptose:LPS heptosyltransferase